MPPRKSEQAPKSFWSTIPGILAKLTGLITAVAGFATTVYPLIQARLEGADVVPIKDFSKKAVLEGGKYKIRDGNTVLLLSIDDIKVQRRIVFVTIGPSTQVGRSIQLAPESPQAVVVGSREYLLTVHDLADVTFGADTAQLTVASK